MHIMGTARVCTQCLVQLPDENPEGGRGLAVALAGTEEQGTKKREILSFL